jgi:broad specificity phosphatase PhoE
VSTQISQNTKLIAIRNGKAEDLVGLPNFIKEKSGLRPLTELGNSGVKKIAEHYAVQGLKVDIIMTSTFKRARQTATILGDHLGIRKQDILETDALVELDETEEIAFQSSPSQALAAADARISHWLISFITNQYYLGKTILIVNHGYAIGSMIQCADNSDPDNRVEVDNASATEFTIKNKVILTDLVNFTVS